MNNLDSTSQPATPQPTGMRGRKARSRALTALILGGLLMIIAFFMLRSGQSHRADYQDFEHCVAAKTTPVCVLLNNGSQATSADQFKHNYENQLLLSEIGLALGGVALAGGAGLLVAQRRRTSATRRDDM